MIQLKYQRISATIAAILLASCASIAQATTPLPVSPQTYSTVPYRGMNLSGAEFAGGSNTNITNLPTTTDVWYFDYLGSNTVRVPFSLEYLVPNFPANGGNVTVDFTQPYAQALVNLVNDLTVHQPAGKAMYVVLDMHNYMHYDPTNISNDYTQNNNFIGCDLIKSTNCGSPSFNLPTSNQYAQVWGQLAAQFVTKTNPHVIFELMNEPQGMQAPEALAIQQAAITAIRNAEKTAGVPVGTDTIMLDGTDWTGLHSFLQTPIEGGPSNAATFTSQKVNDPNYMIDVHQYFDSDYSGQYKNPCLASGDFQNNINMAPFITWARSSNTKVFLGEFGAHNLALNTQNQQMQPVADLASCEADYQYLLNQVTQNTDVFVGYTDWSSGHAWGDYLMNMSPGGPANPYMTDSMVFGNTSYMKPVSSLPPLGNAILGVCNNTNQYISAASSYGPFQTTQPGGIAPGQCHYIYSSDGTDNPTNPNPVSGNYAGLTFHQYYDPNGPMPSQLYYFGVGLTNGTNGDYGFGFGAGPYSVTSVSNSSCPALNLTTPGQDGNRCFSITLSSSSH